MSKINLKIKRISALAKMPTYATSGAAGMDLYAANENPITLMPLERHLIPLGFTMELPQGYEAQIRPRSGMAIKHGITLSNCVGTVDEDYRGEVCVGIVNLSDKPYEVKAGDQVIGTYGGNVAGTMPIGTAQTEGLGKIFTTSLSHMQKTMGAGLSAASGNIGAAADLSALGKAASSYDIINTSMTTHAGAIGGVTCGAGAGLDKDVICYSVAHPTNIEPATMAATMGRPYQKPATLGNLTGYCQCANAHVAAAAEGQELDEIDAFLNGGFYIE